MKTERVGMEVGMKSDYEILGLQEGADEKEIKRAYFKLVRQFTPEKDPERFQEIREAYENLKKGKGREKLILKIPEDAFARKMFEQIETLYRQQNYQRAMETAEEAISHYGECEGFLYYLALLQRKNYYTGKAVKNLEKLVKLSPENVVFAKELAIAYLDRGFGKKAYAAFGKAYEMGCRDIEFLDNYAMNCRERKDYARGIEMLFETIEAGKSDRKEYMLNLLDAYSGLFIMCQEAKGARLEEIKDSFLEFLEEAAPYLHDYPGELKEILCNVLYVARSMGNTQDEYEKLVHDKLKKGLSAEKTEKCWAAAMKEMECLLIEQEPRLSDVMKYAYTAFVLDVYEDYVFRYALLDSKLCILEEWPGIKTEVEIIREDYPNFYEALHEYTDLLENTKSIDVLREKLKKEYDSLGWGMSGGMYYEKHPERRKAETVYLSSGDGDPYVRMQPKVGRNDPCPCGSGKKYKKCCGSTAKSIELQD